MDEKIITHFHQKLSDERLNEHNAHEIELSKIYKEILSCMAEDYSEYRKHVAQFLDSLEKNNIHSLSYSISTFFELYEQVMDTKEFRPFDSSIAEYPANEDTPEKMRSIFRSSFSENNMQRISEENLDISVLSDEEKKALSGLIIRTLQNDSKHLNWSKDMVEVTLMQFPLLRQILVSLNNSELFYHAVGMFLDRLTSSEYYQAGRDVTEEIILSSFKDGIPELGYFNSFRLYSNIASIHASLLYANLSLTCILKKVPPYSEKYVKEIIWQGIKFFRNVKLYPWAAKLYTEMPVGLNFLDYERRSLDHSYFTLLLKMLEPTLPSTLLDYMHKEREEILDGGVNEALPWLLTLYNIRRLYPNADFSVSGFGFYLNIFEVIVPNEIIKKYRDVIEGDSEDLKKHLKESLVKLNETRNIADFVYDNESAIKISNRLIEYSIKNKDVEAFLLSMVLKSDYSILFKSKKAKEVSPMVLPELNVDMLETLYEDKDAFLKRLSVSLNTSMNWLAFSEGKFYQLQLFNKEFLFYSLSEWAYDIYKDLLSTDYFVNLSFSDTVRDTWGVRSVTREEFERDENDIAKKISIAKIYITENAQSAYIVKDMELSKYPHNLFLNQNGEFIAKHIPITNVISTEWLLLTNERENLPIDYSKSIWIPIESADFTLNWLYSGLENTLRERKFQEFKQGSLSKPLSSDINIVCSHGAKNISEVQVMFQENNATYNIDGIIGSGKVLIFFVCYSGSMKTEFFRNNITSMVKRFIAKGYQAVIAPFWALDVTIPSYWLPEFLNSLDARLTISQAVFNANKKVSEHYPTPAAWACLHLYGNPNLKTS